MSTLFALGQQYNAIMRAVNEDGEVDALLDDVISQLAVDESDKIDGYRQLIASLNGEAAVAEAEADQFTAIANQRRNLAADLELRMKDHLLTTNRTAVLSASGRGFKIRKNGGLRKLLLSVGIDDIPPEYTVTKTVTTVEADNPKIREALKKGTLPFAELAPQGCTLVTV